MTQVVITFISGKCYIMYLFLRRFVRFRFWPGALLISHRRREEARPRGEVGWGGSNKDKGDER